MLIKHAMDYSYIKLAFETVKQSLQDTQVDWQFCLCGFAYLW